MRYRTNIRKRLQKHRELHLREVNKKSAYKVIDVTEKGNQSAGNDGNGIGTQDAIGDKVDLGLILRARVNELK